MRIIIFTDSLGRPRPDILESERTYYKDVYGYKLKKNFKFEHEIELIYIESLDTEDAIHWSQRMVAFREPDLVIFQIGVNDCAPRLFKKNTRCIIFNEYFRKITFDFFLKLISYFRYSFTKLRKLVYVSKENYEKNINTICDEILKYNSKCKFIYISTAKSDNLDKKSYHYNQNIEEYNLILKNKFKENYIDINSLISKNGLIFDNIHLNKESHEKLYQVLKNKIGEVDN